MYFHKAYSGACTFTPGNTPETGVIQFSGNIGPCPHVFRLILCPYQVRGIVIFYYPVKLFLWEWIKLFNPHHGNIFNPLLLLMFFKLVIKPSGSKNNLVDLLRLSHWIIDNFKESAFCKLINFRYNTRMA